MFSSIRDKILFVVITIMIISLSLNTVLNYYVSGKSNSDSINTTLQSLADSHTATINEWLQSRIKQINSITENFSVNDQIPILTQVADSGNFLNVDIAMSDKSTVSSDPSGIPDNYDPTSRDWYIEASTRKSTIITRPYHDVSSGKLTVTIAAPLIIGDTVKGVVEGDISLDEIIENVRAIHPTPKSYGMLIDNEGTIIAHTKEDLTLSSISNISKNLKLSQLLLSPSPIEANISGSETYIVARPVQGTSWYVAIAVDKNEAERGMDTLLKVSAISLLLIIIASVMIVGYIMQQSISPLLQVRKSLDDFFAAGQSDLTMRLPVKGKDEIAQIAQSFNGFTEKLVDSMTHINQNSEEIRNAAEEMSNANNDLALRTEESAASLQQTSASLEEISSTVAQSATTAREANNAAQVAADVAIRGREAVGNVIVTMNDIESVSSQIGSITSVINDIAFQTNILALNASVEAARAGEQGRGFAVVANEVRTLASRSAEAAKDISALINKTVMSIASGVQEVESTSKTMNEIVSSISSVTVMMSEISKASEEQTKGISEINRAVSQLDNMVQQNVKLVDDSRSTSTELLEQANDMSSALGRYGIK